MKNDDQKLERLLDLARRGRPAEGGEPRYGFATRVAARWASEGPAHDALFIWEHLAKWGLALAVVFCVLTTALRQRSPKHSALADFAGLNESAERLW